MATSINLRVNDEVEKKLKETVGGIKAISPVGAEVNNSTVLRGALVDFLKRLDKEKSGEKSISFNLKQMKDKEVFKVDETLRNMLEGLDDTLNESEPGYWFMFDLLTMISNQVDYEIIDRRNKRSINK